jgi:hypothetical protein
LSSFFNAGSGADSAEACVPSRSGSAVSASVAVTREAPVVSAREAFTCGSLLSIIRSLGCMRRFQASRRTEAISALLITFFPICAPPSFSTGDLVQDSLIPRHEVFFPGYDLLQSYERQLNNIGDLSKHVLVRRAQLGRAVAAEKHCRPVFGADISPTCLPVCCAIYPSHFTWLRCSAAWSDQPAILFFT